MFNTAPASTMPPPNNAALSPSSAAPATPAAPPALPTSALPPGWKHISSQDPSKGYKLSTVGHTAYVKPAPSGGHNLIIHPTDGRDIDVHPTPLSTPHEAFALAHAKLGRMSHPEPTTGAWDGKESPDGYSTVGGTTYVHQKTVGEKTAFVSALKPGASGSPAYAASGHGPSSQLAHQVHATPQGAHAAAEAFLSTGAPKATDPKTSAPTQSSHPSPTALPPAHSQTSPLQTSHPQAASTDLFHDAGHYAAPPLPGAVSAPPATVPASSVPAVSSPNASAPKPAALPSPKPAALPSPKPAAPEAPNARHHVTLNGTRAGYKNGPVTEDDVDKVAAKVSPGFSNSAGPKVKALVKNGAIKDLDHLHQITAMAKAAPSPHSHISSASVDAAMSYGSITALKDKADAGDASAKAIVRKLGPTSHLSAAEQEAKDFQGQTAGDLMHQKVGGQAGSNPGGFYKTKNGDKVYAKTPADPQQAHSEHAANAIYRALGISAPLSAVTQGADGKTVYGSKIIPHSGTLGSKPLTPELAHDALRGHAADILLANHDVTGKSLDNIVHGADGKVARIDNGGSLLYRAQGAKKSVAETSKIAAWDNFSSPAHNPDYAKLFQAAGVKDAAHVPGMSNQIADIQELEKKHGGWENFLQAHAPGMDQVTRQKTAAMLTKRTALLGEKRAEIMASQGGSLKALAGKTSLKGGTAKSSSQWGSGAFAQYAQKIDGLSSGSETTKHFKPLYAGHTHVYDDLTSPISKWTGSSTGHSWHDQWPAALDGKTHAGALKVQEALQTRRDRWQKLSDTHGVPFPETFHVHRGVSDSDGTILPHIIAAWQNEDEGYMHVKSHPAASWSLSKDAAKGFYGGTNGAMYETHVPFSQTLADKYVDDQSFLHSFPSEHEVVVGGKKDSVIVPKSAVTAKYKGTEYSYAERQKLFDEWQKDKGSLPSPKHFGIDVAEHQQQVGYQKQVGAKVQLQERVQLKERTNVEDKKPDYKNMSGSEYMKQLQKETEAFQAPLIAEGVTPAPLDGTVKPIGSFAEARAEMAAEQAAAGKKSAGSSSGQ
jgi:hypothetical protein